jgi:hypothetical protein
MKISDALATIMAALLASAEIRSVCSNEVHIDYPGDPERDQEYRPANSRAFLYLGPVTYLPLSECGGFAFRVRLYAVSFAADRGEAHDLIQAAIAALDSRYGSTLDTPSVGFTTGGDVIEPFTPKSAYADFAFNL